jgi:CubicO group peptidase (beta-lactamase class C family)/glutamine amidotransferase-like uncharacterized protein
MKATKTVRCLPNSTSPTVNSLLKILAHAPLSIAFVLIGLGPAAIAEKPVRVAVFQGDGVGPSAEDLISALENTGSTELAVSRISAEQIRAGELPEFDVLVHPGGSGSKQGKALGESGRKAVTKFVRDGGGYLGVCGGAYLATNDYSWSLNLIDAKCVDRRHWARGTGSVNIKLSPAASTLFGHAGDQMEIHYGQGPLLGRPEWDDEDVPNYQSLAVYESEIAEKGAPKGVMKGTSAIVRARYGTGRVFCFSPHPEMTGGLEHLIPLAARWLAQVVDEYAVDVPEISRVVRRHVPLDSSGGIAVLVSQNGKVIHCEGYGFVKGKQLTTQTQLSLASVTKQFAAMCAGMLIEEGRLDQKEKVSHYLPELKLKVKERELLVQDLLWHTSGLPNFIQEKEKSAIAEFKKQRGLEYLNNKTHAEWLATMDVRRPPGQGFEYTNSGYVLLTRIIEVITDEPFHEFQKRRIFDVLGMADTRDSARFNGSGNMGTTLLDYAKWDRALWEQDPRLLSTAGYKMLFTRGTLDNGESIDYGFGWRLTYKNGQLISAEHGGVGSGTTAARNLVRRHTADQTTVAIFAQEHPQLNRSDRDVLVSEIYESLLQSK